MIDNILVFGRNRKEHNEKLIAALEKIQRAGLTLNRNICQFSKSRLTFLGQIINGSGVHPKGHKNLITGFWSKEIRNISKCKVFSIFLAKRQKLRSSICDVVS